MIELQRKLIGDNVRNDAFYEALKTTIEPGQHVLDLGSGTGFLAFLASRLGAKNITCIEVDDSIEIAKKLAKRNGISNCTFLHKHSTQVRSLPLVDVLVSETLGNYALEENIIESIEDAKRFLKKDAVIIPGKICQYVCPVISPRLSKEIDIWDAGYDLDFAEARTISLNNIYVKTVKKEDLLEKKDAIRQFDAIDFSEKNSSMRTGEAVWEFSSTTTVYGFALWWEAELVPGITLSTSPLEKPTHWEQIFLPLLESVTLSGEEALHWTVDSDSRWKTKINLAWTVKKIGARGEVLSDQRLDMKKGF